MNPSRGARQGATMMYEFLHEPVARAVGSDFFAGGVALGAIGAAIAILRLFWGRIAGLIARRVWISVTVDNRTQAYAHLLEWLDISRVLAGSRRLRMSGADQGPERLSPDVGVHWFWWQGRLCRLQRDMDPKARITGFRGAQRPMETITLTLLFGRVGTVEGWLADGRARIAARRRIGPGIAILRDGYWDQVGDVPRRAAASVLCDDDRIGRLIADVRRFLGASDWYAERGVPWRRGYLLYGPPGTGKTSAIRAIASEVGTDIAMLDIGRAGLTDDDLREAMMIAPRGALIAIEDVDAAFVEREQGEKRTGVSFSGLLNAIDGVASQEGRALVMTTNHRERLDPALIRPGRADVHVELGPVGAVTAARLFARFFPDEPDLADRFRAALGDARITPAALQGWLLANVEDPARAATAEELVPALSIAAE